MRRREFLVGGLASLAAAGRAESVAARIRSVAKETLWRNRDGRSTTWFHPRACMVPGADGGARALMTLQPITGSDYFGPVHWSASEDLGRTWSDPVPIPSLGRKGVAGHEGLEQGVCDVVPEFHARSGTVLALGHSVFYRGDRFSKGDQLARYPVYSVRRGDGGWSEARRLEWDDPRGGEIYTNGCGQRVTLEDGDILLALSFSDGSVPRRVASARCAFDGDMLKIREIGPELAHPVKRGLLEPSMARFGGRFFLTIRAEDDRGYVSASGDGMRWEPKRPWAWDDGEPLTMSTTQQHWVTHSDGLFLAYTRKDPSNLNVMRWRAPIFIARVDPDRLCLVRDSERVALPLVGDGVNDPDNVALMGNFHANAASPGESWITVGEWMPKRQARGDALLARIAWELPNGMVGLGFAAS